MNTKRLRAIAKLLFLFGTPLAFIAGLFSAGVYVGAENRHGITKFERDWLSLDVEVPPAPEAQAAEEIESSPASAAATTEAGSESPREKATERVETPPTVSDQNERAEPVPLGPADPLAGELADQFANKITITVKVLVDDDVVAADPAWIDYAQRIVSEASSRLDEQFGISLELAAVGRWPVTIEGADTHALMADLVARSPEGADVIVGLTDVALSEEPGPQPLGPTAEANGTRAVVHPEGSASQRHLRPLLREVSRLLGALEISSSSDPAWSSSWMSYAEQSEDQSLSIDRENRQRVIARKTKPFVGENGGGTTAKVQN